MTMQIGTINRDGYALRFQIEGEGISALVIGSSHFYPRTFSENLRKTFQFTFLDHRGFAKTDSEASCELTDIIEDIEHCRKELQLGEITIIGHSGHGYMALEYAKAYPEHISRVILIGMGPSHNVINHDAAEQALQDSVCLGRKAYLQKALAKLPKELEAHPEKRFITYCLANGARSWYDYTYDATSLWENVHTNMVIIDHLWGEVFRDIDITKDLEKLSKPVFLALGRYDFLIAPPYTWNPIRDKFQNLTLRIFEQSGHTPQLEEPEQFDQELLYWLEQK